MTTIATVGRRVASDASGRPPGGFMPTLDPERMRESTSRFAQRCAAKRIFPERLTLELSYACNLACPACPRHSVTAPPAVGRMGTDLALRLVDEASANGVTALVPFFRGESVLHPDLAAIVAHAKRRGIASVQLASNATLMTPERAALLLDAGLDFVSFSVDTIDPALYAQRRQNGELETTLANIEAFLRLRDERGAATKVQISSVELPRTAEGAAQAGEQVRGRRRFIDYWLSRGCDVRFYPRHSENGVFGSLAPENVAPHDKRLPCLKPVLDMVVLADGSAAVCNHDWDRGANEPLGDVAASSIEAVYNGPAYRELRRRHGQGDLAGVLPCGGCDHWQVWHVSSTRAGELYVSGT